MNGVPTGKILIAIFVIVIAMAAVFIIGSLQGGGTSTSSTTTTPTVVTPAKAPKDYLPAAVAGFEATGKNDQVAPSFTGEESAATISFKPAAGSMFENKVGNLSFYAHLFKDTKSAASLVSQLGANTIMLELEINGKKARLSYKKDNGQAIMFIQIDRTVVYCFARPPSGATTFDESMLKNAVIMGFSAIKF